MRKMALALASLFVVIMITSLVAPEVKAQKRGGPTKFSLLASAHAAYSAAGRNICSNEPAIGLEIGYTPISNQQGSMMVGIRMRPLTPYSPVGKDSSWIEDPNDTLFGGHYKRFYHKTATLLATVGVSGGKENGLGGGINTGVGLSFLEIKDRLYTCAVWDFSLQGEYNFAKKYGVFVTATYSYIWSRKQLGKNGMTVLVGGGLKMKF